MLSKRAIERLHLHGKRTAIAPGVYFLRIVGHFSVGDAISAKIQNRSVASFWRERFGANARTLDMQDAMEGPPLYLQPCPHGPRFQEQNSLLSIEYIRQRARCLQGRGKCPRLLRPSRSGPLNIPHSRFAGSHPALSRNYHRVEE